MADKQTANKSPSLAMHQKSAGSPRRLGPATLPVLGLMLPMLVPLALALATRPGRPLLETAVCLATLVLVAATLAFNLAFRLQTGILRRNSPVVVASGQPRVGTLIQTVVVLLQSLGMAGLLVPGLPVPVYATCSLLAGLSFLSLTQGTGSSTQYWLKTCVILENRVVNYEDIESIVQIPWQGFDIRLRQQTLVIEVRRQPAETGQLLDRLKPVLVPYGIKLQLHAGPD